MSAQLILTTALLAAPPEWPPPDPFESELDQIEVIRGDDEAQIAEETGGRPCEL